MPLAPVINYFLNSYEEDNLVCGRDAVSPTVALPQPVVISLMFRMVRVF